MIGGPWLPMAAHGCTPNSDCTSGATTVVPNAAGNVHVQNLNKLRGAFQVAGTRTKFIKVLKKSSLEGNLWRFISQYLRPLLITSGWGKHGRGWSQAQQTCRISEAKSLWSHNCLSRVSWAQKISKMWHKLLTQASTVSEISISNSFRGHWFWGGGSGAFWRSYLDYHPLPLKVPDNTLLFLYGSDPLGLDLQLLQTSPWNAS